jgi:hypothetical protein
MHSLANASRRGGPGLPWRFLRALFVVSLSVVLVAAATRVKDPKKVPDKTPAGVRKWMHSMSLRDKVAQLLVMPIYAEPANTRSATFRKYQHFVRDLHVGGVIVTGFSLNGGLRNAEPYALAATLNRMQ